ncbi:MAG TPA: hypothetical protein VIG99_16375 [Myxococcaceae bacterium]
MAHGPRGPRYALDGVRDRYPKTPIPGLKLHIPSFEEPLVGIGEGDVTSLQQLQRDQDLVRRVVNLLPMDEVRAAVQAFAHQSEALTQALGGRELVSEILGELGSSLSREESALLHSELEHELGGPLDDSSESTWVEREAEHARWELTRHWIALVLSSVQGHGSVPLGADLCPSPPAGRQAGGTGDDWSASPEEVEEALLASVAVGPESLDALMRSFHGRVSDAVARSGPLELPGHVELVRQGDLLVATPHSR